MLSREAQMASQRGLSAEPRGQLVSIADAPSLRRRRLSRVFET